jgi:hypothetical protein
VVERFHWELDAARMRTALESIPTTQA